MSTIYNIVGDGGLLTTRYFSSAAEALNYAYAHLGIKHDYQVQILPQDIPTHFFTKGHTS